VAERRVVSCGARYGEGGLGQHLAQVIEDSRIDGTLRWYFSTGPRPGDTEGIKIGSTPRWLLGAPPVRFRPDWRRQLTDAVFDREVERRLDGADVLSGFGGQALRSFARARSLGYARLELESPTLHVAWVARQLETAHRACGLERPWLSRLQRSRIVREYDVADLVYVTSALSHQTFVDAGYPEAKLRRRALTVDPRYRPAQCPPADDLFRVVYVGSLSVAKGIPVLLQAFEALRLPEARLTLVGGWGTRGMRRVVEGATRRDSRIEVAKGDPLPFVQQASAYVHPSFSDGFGYAPMEALACGVLVIVTENTGMKEHVREGVDGFVVPAGSAGAIRRCLEEIASGRSSRR
jgi:glycosyltransferase involved in cell wall biosynthesis